MRLTTTELSKRTGVSKKQIQVWCQKGYLQSVEEPNPGFPRIFESDVIARVEFLVIMSKAKKELTLGLLNECYDMGCIYITDDIVLIWPVP